MAKQIPDVHLIPVNDKLQHYDSPLCPCGPEDYGTDPVDPEPAYWWLHNAMDGREDGPLRDAVKDWIVVGPASMGELHAAPVPFLDPSPAALN